MKICFAAEVFPQNSCHSVLEKCFSSNGCSCLPLPEGSFLLSSRLLFSNLGLEETSVSETGRTCLHEAANTNTDPPECICYPTTTLQLAEQTVTHTWEPWANHIVYRTQHQHLEPGEDYVNLWLYLPATSCSRKKKEKKKGWSYFPFFLMCGGGRRFHIETQKYAVFEENRAELAK